jgi:hypothetical protein
VVEANFPLLSEEGWLRDQEKSREASIARADGVVFNLNKILWNLDHHPVRSIKDASRYFVEVAAIPSSGRRGKIPNMTEID